MYERSVTYEFRVGLFGALSILALCFTALGIFGPAAPSPARKAIGPAQTARSAGPDPDDEEWHPA